MTDLMMTDKERADLELVWIVSNFNLLFREWSKKHAHGANFGFTYVPETGEKQLHILDLAPLDPARPSSATDPRAVAAAEQLKQAVAQADSGSLVL
jgi:hypothetical protein